VRVDGRVARDGPGPVVIPVDPGKHEVVIEVEVSRYERRIACGQRVRVGRVEQTIDGLGTIEFDSPYAARGGGHAVVFVPPRFDLHQTRKLLVGLHPWNGSIWTYAAYQELLDGARAHGVVLLMPSGLGNSLYTADAEDEVLRAIQALAIVIGTTDGGDPLQPLDISIWGASMGGAGATTIGFHHPDRFATVTSFFGDSSYDLSTYVRSILVDQHGAHRVNALDVVDNARNVPVWLIHGEDDATSPIRQSEILAEALKQRGYAIRFDRIGGIGHSGALVARFLPDLVELASRARTEHEPQRVTYRSVRPSDVCAYGMSFRRESATLDAFIDVAPRENPPRFFQRERVGDVYGPGKPCTSP
jgi:pimeloyl-ACP methyl ester carboxylesterase